VALAVFRAESMQQLTLVSVGSGVVRGKMASLESLRQDAAVGEVVKRNDDRLVIWPALHRRH
jgi:hypothetical protein